VNLELRHNGKVHSRVSHNKQRKLSITFIKNFFVALVPLELRVVILPLHILILSVILLPCFASAQTIAGGYGHSLAICSDNTARAWGWNLNGQLGNGNKINSKVPVQVSNLSAVIAVAGGEGSIIVVEKDAKDPVSHLAK
jgi:alpha-tubulin suppressor-like RCC1 family protein